jgi:hypothetical protein
MGDHIFICFSSKDKDTALEIVDFLEREGLECWISVRDVPGGHNYQETIIHALERANCIVFLFSHASSESGEIKKELSVAASLSMPVFPLRLDPVTPKGALRYELATRQWIDIFEDRDEGLARLVETIRSKIHNNSAPDPEAGADDLRESPAPRIADVVVEPPPAKKRTRVRAPIVAPGSREFEAMRSLLARHIGPIAKIYVEKAATQAKTKDDFCERLAAHISAPADRTAFLNAARAQLGSKA